MGKQWAELPAKNSALTEKAYILTDVAQVGGSYPRNFSIGYDKTKKAALWVAYPMHDYYVAPNSSSSNFTYDRNFEPTEQMHTGGVPAPYNKGHQVASADRKVSSKAREQIYYMTNITPQLATFNNSPYWATLEGQVRSWMCSDTLYVVTGCYFDGTQTSVTDDGGYECPVPTHYYKVLLRSKSGATGQPVSMLTADRLQCIGFWYVHNSGNGQTASSNAMSVEDVEERCGLEFFVNVPSAPKATFSRSDWTGL